LDNRPAWIVVVAIRVLADTWRRHTRRERPFEDNVFSGKTFELRSHSALDVKKLETENLLERIERITTEEERQLLTMAHIREMNAVEIGKATNTSPFTVRYRIRQLKKGLRQKLSLPEKRRRAT
jgi:DNA-directed RNA polymerase specialized sigma24 family protein